MRMDYFTEFVCFAKHLSIVNAAEELFISPSTLSKHIAEFEKILDVKLINHGKSPSLTNIGNAVLKDASYILQKYKSLRNKCDEYKNSTGERRSIRVLDPLMSSTGVKILYSIVLGFVEAYPEVQLSFVPQGKFAPMSAFRNDVVDVFLKYDYFNELDIDCENDNPEFVALPLVREPLLLWCRKDSEIAKHDEVSFQSLENYSIMSSTSKPSPLEQTLAKIAKKKKIDLQFATYSTLTESEFFLQNVPDNHVYIITPRFAEDLFIKANKSMVIKNFKDDDVATTCFLIIRADSDNINLQLFSDYAEKIVEDRDELSLRYNQV